MATFTVVYDACLFYPAPLRDLMIRLAVVTTAAKQQRAALKDPPLSPAEFVNILRRQGLPSVAAFLQNEIELI